jgi:hypothetical protein
MYMSSVKLWNLSPFSFLAVFLTTCPYHVALYIYVQPHCWSKSLYLINVASAQSHNYLRRCISPAQPNPHEFHCCFLQLTFLRVDVQIQTLSMYYG